jgi:valyl-tRNA synthetase
MENLKEIMKMQKDFSNEIELLEQGIKELEKKEFFEKNDLKKIEENTESILSENNKIIEDNRKIIEENESIIEKNKKIIEENENLKKSKEESLLKISKEISEKKNLIEENKKLIEENKQYLEDLKTLKVSSEEPVKKEIAKDIEKALELKNVGAIFFNKNDYEKSIEKFEEALLYVPEDDLSMITILNSNIGICLMRLEKYQDSVLFFDNALAQNPNFVKAQVNRAECNYQMQKYEECLNDYEDLLKKNPKFVNLEKYQEVKRLHQQEFEKKKEEVMGQMKDLGNKFLGMFGMSVDNFKLNQSQNGGYNISFQQ